MTDCRDVRMVACAGQTTPAGQYGMLPPGTGPGRELTGSVPGTGLTQTGKTQCQRDPSATE